MAKLLGHDIVTTQELKDFEERVVGGLLTEVATAKAKVETVKKHYLIVGIIAIVSALLTIYMIIH